MLLWCLPGMAQAPAPVPTPDVALYQQLGSVGLDPARVYRVREFDFDREQLHITLDEGTLAFTTAVDGHVTGAFFSGDGEVLLMPPDNAERRSLAVFTGAAILEDRFTTAYFRFSDDFARALQPYLRPADDAPEFITQWDSSARQLASTDALRLLAIFANHARGAESPRYLHARVGSVRLGPYDVFYDSASTERIAAVQGRVVDGQAYLDVWTSFSGRLASPSPPSAGWTTSDYRISATVLPPRDLSVETSFSLQTDQPGQRIVSFELSRFLHVAAATADGLPIEVIQNPALQGSQLARRGNDVLALGFPQPLPPGRKVRVVLRYAGDVLSDAGGGLMYVGARGTWYPTRGLAFTNFDLDFTYPAGWRLIATGRLVSEQRQGNEIRSHYVSDATIPLAGFNLGQYALTGAKVGNVAVNVYAAHSFENSLHPVQPPAAPALPPHPRSLARPPIPPPLELPPDPGRNAQLVSRQGVAAIEFYSGIFGPYPYSSLAFTQMPGRDSQGWPGLIFLSSYAFLPEESRTDPLGDSGFANFLYDHLVAAHETAHQWWGDSVAWSSYRDQWMMEGMSNYAALMLLERDQPEGVAQTLEHYRKALLRENAEGVPLLASGPVTLGQRLSSSHFPEGYDVIAYGRGTWLLHMLRSMLRDASPTSAEGDRIFLGALRGLLEKHRGEAISTADLQAAFERVWPPRLNFEGSSSLDWFFQGWVNGSAIPRLSLEKVSFSHHGGKHVVTGRLLQSEAPSSLVTSVPLYVVLGSSRQPVFLARIFADGNETPFHLAVPAGAHKLLLDPYHTVLTRP